MRFSERYTTTTLLHQNDRVQIFIAEDHLKSQTVVIKALKQEMTNPYEVSKFRREYNILSKIEHESIVKALDYYEGHQVYLVLEHIDAKPLRAHIHELKDDMDAFLDMAIQCAKALEHIHLNNVIHKDINPSNLLWDPASRKLSVIDFNISEEVSHESQGFCSPNNLQGTLPYISPEQTGRMNRLIDYRTDFYSFGIMLYEIITGRKPFKYKDRLQLIHAHIAQMPEAPSDLDLGISFVLSEVIMKLLEKDSSQRYQSEYGIIKDLEYFKKLNEKGDKDIEFLPGKEDRASKFVSSQDVYGRDDEIELLLSAYSLVHNGSSMNMFVTGRSGVGKTTVIQELFKPVTTSNGTYVYGKFDQFKRDIPYSAFVEAFSDFVRIILSEDETELVMWRHKILSNVGESGKLLIDLVPDIENIIGNQPELPRLDGLEAQNRFNYIIHKFIQSISGPQHPLVLFIDDLQWIDSASLSLLKLLLEDTELEHLFIVGAYRDNEVSRSHPLKMSMADLESRGVEVQTMHLDNLSDGDIYDMVSDTFKGISDPGQLTNLIMEKTKGNAFFAKQMIMRLYMDRVVRYDHEKSTWTCSANDLIAYEVSADVVEFMKRALADIRSDAKDIIDFLSCFGRKMTAENMAQFCERDISHIENSFIESIQKGIVSKSSDGEYGFVHDKVQEAVYENLSADEKMKQHSLIATKLIGQYAMNRDLELIFDIVNHVERGQINLIDFSGLEMVDIYFAAGQKAIDSSAHILALSYLKQAVSLIEGSWSASYTKTLGICNKAAEASYLSGDFEYLNALSETIMENADRVEDKALIYGLNIQSYMSQNKHLEGVQVALKSISDFGVDIPLEPTMEDAGAAFQTVGALLSEVENVNDLLELSLLDNESLAAVMRILADIVPIVFNAAPGHLPLVVCKMVEISIKHGNSVYSPFAYSLYALLLCGIIGDIKLGTAFGDLSIDLVNKLDAKSEFSRTYNMVGLHVMHFKDHLDRVTRTLEMAYLKGLEYGDHLFAGFAGHGYCINYYFSGNELNRTRKVFENYTHSLENINQGTQTTFQNAYTQAIINLLEDTDEPWIFKGDAFNEFELIPEIQKRGHKTALLVTYFQKMYLGYMFGNYEKAYEYARKVEENLDAGVGLILIPNYYAFDSLIRIKLIEKGAENIDHNEQMMIIHGNQTKLSGWCDLGKDNYLHRYLMVDGEIKKLNQEYQSARQAYEEALSIVVEAGYLNEEALYRERIAEFYQVAGNRELHDHYLETAYISYRKWGANNKAKRIRLHLETAGKELRTDKSIMTIHESSTTKDFNTEMDLKSILKSSQAIAKEIVYESLLENMLEILIENAGAERAVIINYQDSGDIVCARKEIGQTMVLIEGMHDVRSLELPSQILNYVHNSKKAVLLRSAFEDSFFGQDAYIKANKVQSLLCFPVIRQAEIIAIMYIENNLASGVFTEQRVDVLNLLSTQIAISLKNAMMYRHMESLVQERTVELEKKNSTLERLNNQLQLISVTDGLTQLFNRRKIDEILYYERERYLRYGHSFSVILLDIDKFKNINDTYGHHVGDQVLINIADLIKGSVRKVDVVGRWGGEEFMIICPDTSKEQAITLAESVRKVIEVKNFENVDAVTSSFGVAEIDRNDDIESLIKRVDDLLYRAKENGRNRVEA